MNRSLIRLLQVASLLMLLLQIGLLFRPDPQFLSRPLTEDAFYAMSVGRSLGEGNGFTIDGNRSTNGVQPLICVLYAPIFALSDDGVFAPLKGVVALQITLFVLAALTGATYVSSLVRDRSFTRTAWWLTFAFLYVNYSVSVHSLNGLETGLSLFLVFLSLHACRRLLVSGKNSYVHWAGLGALFGLTVLSRIDTALLVVCVVVWILLRDARSDPKRGVSRAALVGLAAVLVSSPWWYYNIVEFGSLMPTSGTAQQTGTMSLLEMMNQSTQVLGDAVIPGLHAPSLLAEAWPVHPSTLIPAGVLLAAFVWRGQLRKLIGTIRENWTVQSLVPYTAFGILLVLFYTIWFQAPHFQDRYLLHPSLLILFAELIGLSALFLRSRRIAESRWTRLAVGALLLASLVPFGRNYTNAYGNPTLDAVDWIEENTTANDRIGMFQSGTAGYVYPDRVTNLDGKVNADALAAFLDGRMPSYADSAGFDYIIDWSSYTDRVFQDSTVRNRYRRIDSLSNRMIVWERKAGLPNESQQEDG